jgi:hypothetical protein
MSSSKRFVPGVLLFVVLGLALPAAAQTGGMQNGPFDGMSSDIVVPGIVPFRVEDGSWDGGLMISRGDGVRGV